MSKIQINILLHSLDRIKYTLKSLDFLKKIKSKNKELIKVVLIGGENPNFVKTIIEDLITSNIDSEYVFIPKDGNNYMNKIKYCVNNTNFEYSCSMDEDILLSNFLWDYIIENVSVLDSENNLFLSPLISNGIPSVDLFIDDFFNKDDKEIIHKIFQETTIDNYWGVDYSSLNKERRVWDYYDYYNDVKKLNHFYKGIHPVRISYDAHKKIAEVVCENSEKIISNCDFNIEQHKFPYFCNSFFLIKTSVWREIINNDELYRDMFDEVPLNLYMQKNDLSMCLIRNGFCIHMAYNTIGQLKQKDIENFFYNNLLNKI
jgi:hypothetical protein